MKEKPQEESAINSSNSFVMRLREMINKQLEKNKIDSEEMKIREENLQDSLVLIENQEEPYYESLNHSIEPPIKSSIFSTIQVKNSSDLN